MLGLIILVGFLQSWSMALSILCLCLISAVMTMGANIQWGYAGLINFGIMGYTALGGLAAVLVSVPPVREAWQVGGFSMILSAFYIKFGARLERLSLDCAKLERTSSVCFWMVQKCLKIFQNPLTCIRIHQNQSHMHQHASEPFKNVSQCFKSHSKIV